jgi:hypothetical protein
MSIRCSHCGIIKPSTEFNWKIIGIKKAKQCKECSRAYIRNHYARNKKYYLLKAQLRNARIKNETINYIGLYLTTHNCVDCGEKDILVLEFDHKDRNSKVGDINTIIKTYGSLKKVKDEISKCDIRCANCHRRKTARENASWKLHFLRS